MSCFFSRSPCLFGFLGAMCLTFFLGACSPKPIAPVFLDAVSDVRDLRELAQDPAAWLDSETAQLPIVSPQEQMRMDERFNKQFFSPWDKEKTGLSAKNAFWGAAVYGKKQAFGENKRPRDSAWVQGLIDKQRISAFPSMARKAVAVRNAALRVMPTQRPFFKDFEQAGEGFPFDYFQNSALWAGTPVFVSHAAEGGDWLFVESGFASGWVRPGDVAFVDDYFISQYKSGDYIAVLKDDSVFVDGQGKYLLTAHVGAIFPRGAAAQSVAGSFGQCLVPVRERSGEAVLVVGVTAQHNIAPKPLPLTAARVAGLARELAGQSYGWGGMYENRDCSAMLKDLFAPFGVWLPRNSTGQGKVGQVISLENLSPAQKKETILELGVPFFTLVWMRGHIMLYIGEKSGEPIVFHNIWGVRTQDQWGRAGRHILGGAVVTTLAPGKELPDAVAEKSLVNRVQSLNILNPGAGEK